MNIRPTSVLLSAALLAPVLANASGPADPGLLPTAANRIVGLWTTEGTVRNCTDPSQNITVVRNTLLFMAGGTVIENPRVLPNASAPGSRSFAIGTWSYDLKTQRHSLMLRFDTYASGAYSGYQIVDRELRLDAQNRIATGDVVVTAYDVNGARILERCGSATSTRQ